MASSCLHSSSPSFFPYSLSSFFFHLLDKISSLLFHLLESAFFGRVKLQFSNCLGSPHETSKSLQLFSLLLQANRKKLACSPSSFPSSSFSSGKVNIRIRVLLYNNGLLHAEALRTELQQKPEDFS